MDLSRYSQILAAAFQCFDNCLALRNIDQRRTVVDNIVPEERRRDWNNSANQEFGAACHIVAPELGNIVVQDSGLPDSMAPALDSFGRETNYFLDYFREILCLPHKKTKK